MGTALRIREDFASEELRRYARREFSGRPAARLYAIANALDGLSRKEAAELAGMDRQSLRGETGKETIRAIVSPSKVIRFNEEGLAGMHDRPKGHRKHRLGEDEEARLAEAIVMGPNPERDGISAWTRADMCQWIDANFSRTCHPSSLSRAPRRTGFSRQKVRPSSPRADAQAQERFRKAGSATR